MTHPDPRPPRVSASPYRGRFAPSPTGPLHLGSLTAALASWLFARQAGGEWLVRIEDIDPPRERPGVAERQLAALAAFGLEPDRPVLRQSHRQDAYRAALDSLMARGLAFDCWCSRADLAALNGRHRRCINDRRERPPAQRVRVPDDCQIGFEDRIYGSYTQRIDLAVGDFPLRRGDGCYSYQLAVVVDDHHQGITEVVRGADLLDSTPRQILLQRMLGLSTPRHAHIPLLLDAAGNKLSKSLAALPVDPSDPLPALRAAWVALDQPATALGGLGAREPLLAVAIERFDPGRIRPIDRPAPGLVRGSGQD